MQKTFAFVDESGDPSLHTEKQGVSRFFVVCSILVDEENLSECYEKAEYFRAKHFQTGEIKFA